MSATESANVHEKTSYAYSLRGEVTGTTTAAGATTTAGYNIFGELSSSNAGSGFTAIDYTYDARGLQELTRRGSTTFEDRTFDAFGRLATIDRCARQYHDYRHDVSVARWLSSRPATRPRAKPRYDGFSRVLTVRDKLTNTTTYAYNDSTRTVTVTTPGRHRHLDGAQPPWRHAHRHGEWQHDHLHIRPRRPPNRVSDSLGALEGRSYDRAGRQVTSTDARGTVTTLAYDASSRMITRTEDSASGGLQLVTTYATTPRAASSTLPSREAASPARSTIAMDASSRSSRIRTAPRRAHRYAYDAASNILPVTEGLGSANPRRTQYVYDTAGPAQRRIRRSDQPGWHAEPAHPVPL